MPAIDASDAPDVDHFVVHISRNQGHEARVNSVELMHSDIRNRYSFRLGRSFDDLFAPALARALKDALARLEPSERLLAMPGFKVSLPGLVLGGLRILSNKLDDGSEAIMIRVRDYVGAIKSAFRFDTGMAIEPPVVRERIAVEVLRDIVNPLLDILSIAKDAPPEVVSNNADALSRQLRRMGTRQEELHFYTGLLQRYITGCREDAERATVNPDMETNGTKRLFNGY